MESLPLIRVALPVPLGKAFTYRSPFGRPPSGVRVLVDFGRRQCIGVVVGEADAPPEGLDPSQIKPIRRILDEKPAVPGELLEFLLELSRYYLAPIGEVLRLALPVLERGIAAELERENGKKWKAAGRLSQVASLTPLFSAIPPDIKGQSAEIWAHLRETGPVAVTDLVARWKSARSALKKLTALGAVDVRAEERAADPFFRDPVARDHAPTLNAGQRAALEAIRAPILKREGSAFLLDGITASGKTEVYLHAAAETLATGRSVVLLVPEIALTPQLVARFRARLGDEIAVIHSELTELERLQMWRGIREGRLRVIVGARSALFAPTENLGLICVDEEHDPSYKQEEGVRYNARDMALLRAQRNSAVCILGSATPSLSSEALVRQGKLTRLVLRQRAHENAVLPEVELIDLKRFGPGPSGEAFLSIPLHRAIEEALEKKGQVILFLNRRGFSPSLLCSGCGAIAECPNCSVALTLHRVGRERVECHYCQYQARPPEVCSSCGGAEIAEEGLGTERVQHILGEQFPTARILRLDRDVGSGKKVAQVMNRMRAREADILVGTQMVTKGHDLPGVTLVGVLNADAALGMPDFRAAERTFHLLVQVAGRAGRAEQRGKVLIQTRNPEHPALVAAATHDVPRFIREEMEARHEARFPPYAHVALVRFDGSTEAEVRLEAERVSHLARAAVGEHADILGPAPAPLSKLNNRFRYRFLVRALSRAPLRAALLAALRAAPHKRVRLQVDVDPMSLL